MEGREEMGGREEEVTAAFYRDDDHLPLPLLLPFLSGKATSLPLPLPSFIFSRALHQVFLRPILVREADRGEKGAGRGEQKGGSSSIYRGQATRDPARGDI